MNEGYGTSAQASYFIDGKSLSAERARQQVMPETRTSLNWESLLGKKVTILIKKEPTMKHLTTHNNWIIALRNGKLVAFDNKGGFIEALGSIIYAGGHAWMYVDGQLWSGALERHYTDAEKLAEKQEQVRQKHAAKMKKIHEKCAQQVVKNIEARTKELAALEK